VIWVSDVSKDELVVARLLTERFLSNDKYCKLKVKFVILSKNEKLFRNDVLECWSECIECDCTS
jgi:hypothetical protein